jgi:hypothetical protein
VSRRSRRRRPNAHRQHAAAGYDANIDAVRLTLPGSMAANSSFTIRFRARIN